MSGDAGRSASSALHSRGLAPRKRLGQNFLRDRSFLPKIVDAVDAAPGQTVVEIGAGTGVLTQALLESGAHVTAIELDDSLARLLGEEFAGETRLRIWHGNALDFDPCSEVGERYRLAGNIPYYITAPIVRHFLETPCRPEVMVLMVQREVADRMVAPPGGMSLLGLGVQYYAEPKIVVRVPAGAFYPRPKVDSAVVRLVPRIDLAGREQGEAERVFALARAGFGTKRKQLLNALSHGLSIDREAARALLSDAGIDERRRAEDLAVEDWRRLAASWGSRAV